MIRPKELRIKKYLWLKWFIFIRYFSPGCMFEHLYPSSPLLQMLTSKILVHDPKNWMTILCVFHTLFRAYGRCSRKWLLILLNSTLFITKALDFIISFELYLVYQAASYINGALSCIYTFFMRNRFISHYSSPKKV